MSFTEANAITSAIIALASRLSNLLFFQGSGTSLLLAISSKMMATMGNSMAFAACAVKINA